MHQPKPQVVRRPRSAACAVRRGSRALQLVLVAALGLGPQIVAAQRPISAALRDSAMALLADSLLDDTFDTLPPRPVHQLSFRSIARRYTVAGTAVRELSAPITYRVTGNRFALQLSGTPVAFDAPLGTLSGATPIRGRLSWRMGRGDTLQLIGQLASTPAGLSTSETAALGSVAISTVDLESIAIGLPASIAVRGVLTQPIGPVAVSLTASGEVQPRPATSAPVFWRGRTATGGLSVSGFTGDARLMVGAEWSHSSADSLDGRNLFPGGGLVTLQASIDGPLGDLLGGRYGTLAAFWLRPYQNARADQPNRLIPQGSFWGVQGDLSFDRGRITLAPTASLLRESSRVDIGTALVPTLLTSTGWTLSGGTALDVRVGSMLTLSPEVGVAVGSVGSSSSTLVRTRRGRSLVIPRAVDDPISGGWVGLSVRMRW
jgi:hypothetical protein